jgi:hypothetical protein
MAAIIAPRQDQVPISPLRFPASGPRLQQIGQSLLRVKTAEKKQNVAIAIKLSEVGMVS